MPGWGPSSRPDLGFPSLALFIRPLKGVMVPTQLDLHGYY